MRVSVILALPNDKSFNHAIAETVLDELKQRGREIYFHVTSSEEQRRVWLQEVRKLVGEFSNKISASGNH